MNIRQNTSSFNFYIIAHVFVFLFLNLQVGFAIANEQEVKLRALAGLGELDRVKSLLEKHVNVNAKDADGTTALMMASERGNDSIVKLLLNAHAFINQKEDSSRGNTALMYASENGHAQVVRTLLNAKAEVNLKNRFGLTALQLAKNAEVIKVFDEFFNNTPSLINATEAGDLNQVKLFLADKKSDVNMRNKDDFTSLMIASRSGNIQIVEALISAKADVNADVNFYNHNIGSAIQPNYIPYQNTGMTALMYASRNGYSEIVQTLITAKADINKKDNNGLTALLHATSGNQNKIVQILIAANTDVNVKTNSGYNALISASFKGYTEVVKSLLAAKADVNLKDSNGTTALEYATWYKQDDVVRLLNPENQKHNF